MENATPQKFSKIIPPWKFALLSICTFGIYELLFFCRTWGIIKEQREIKVSPLARAIFGALFIWSFTSQVKKLAKENDIKINHSTVFIATLYFILFACYKLPDPFWLISTFTFLPIMIPLQIMNAYYKKTENDLEQKKFSILQIILIAIGCILFLVGALASFLPPLN
jgi:hypothetical protein